MNNYIYFKNLTFIDYKSLELNEILSFSDKAFTLFLYNVNSDILNDLLNYDDIILKIFCLKPNIYKIHHATVLPIKDKLLERIDLMFFIEDNFLINIITSNFDSEFYFKLYNKFAEVNHPFLKKYDIKCSKDLIYRFIANSEEKQLIYDKYNIISNTIFDIKLLNIPKAKHIKSLYNLMKEKDFDLCIKLYLLIGYDNARKILNNNFTYNTESELIRVGKLEFTIKQRLNKINSNKKDEDLAFKDLDKKEIKEICQLPIEEFSEVIRKLNDFNEKIEEDNYSKNYAKNNIKEREEVTNEELNRLFDTVDYGKIINLKYKSDLIEFLLGNTKKANDCLLRMVLNNNAFGIEKSLCTFINDFDKIKEQSMKSGLKITSLLDVIDYIKSTSYKLLPNEMDIPLSTIVKIINSRQFCDKKEDKILNDLRNIQEKRKQNYKSSIPEIKNDYDGVKYEILNNSDNQVLTIGIDCGSCFKIGGGADEYFKYTLTSKHSKILKLTYENIMYLCPLNRNGNAVFINAIEPKIKNKDTRKKVVLALRDFSEKIQQITSDEEPIEIVAMSNLHMDGIIDNLPEFEFIKSFFLDNEMGYNKSFYCDLNKDKEIDNITVRKLLSVNKFKTYEPKPRFLTKRKEQICFKPHNEKYLEEVSIKINSIYYSYLIENNLESTYNKIIITNYEEIIYNDDWFLLKNNFEEFSVILNRDIRATIESTKIKKGNNQSLTIL